MSVIIHERGSEMKWYRSKAARIILIVVALLLLVAALINGYQSGKRDAARDRERNANQTAK